MQWIRSTFTIFSKDLHTELRTRFALNMVLAFVAAAMLLILFAVEAQHLEPGPKSGLIWVIILFAALSSLSRSFISETDKNTFDLLRLNAAGSVVYSGKLLYNFIFTLLVNVVSFALYIFLTGMAVQSWSAFLVILLLGTAGLSAVSTMTAALVSQADRKGAIFSVLSIPLFMPLILLLTDISKTAFVSGGAMGMNNFAALAAFAGVTLTAGLLLFDFIWEE